MSPPLLQSVQPIPPFSALDAQVYARALDARDPRFDGVFFVGITSTRIYCRPVCPARVSRPDRRRFFASAATAEHAGFRPCLRCRPELAPGRAPVDAVSCLARAAALRIAAGALNRGSVGGLAEELGVSERQLRRAMERELGVAPGALAQTHRLLLAKCLLTDTNLSVTRIAFASGFQSLRRFNAVFRARYRMNPTALRGRKPGEARRTSITSRRVTAPDLVRLTLAYRPPLAWDALLALLARDATPGVERVDADRYARTVRVDDATGVAVVSHTSSKLLVDVSLTLVPVLMPLLAGLRQLLDLDAEPQQIDALLAARGLDAQVARHPGVRVPGAFDGFALACRLLIQRATGDAGPQLAAALATALGEPIATGIPGLTTLGATAARIAQAGATRLTALGLPRDAAGVIAAVARAVVDRRLILAPGRDVAAAQRVLAALGVDDDTAATLVMRALHWPDGFCAASPAAQRDAGVTSADALLAVAEPWRPWRAYAAVHLWLDHPRKELA